MRIIPVASDAWRFAIPLSLVGGFLLWLDQKWSVALGSAVFLATLFVLFFFRDFNRKTPPDDNLLYSPGDGKILDISDLDEGPASGQKVIRIFLSVLNGHIQRSPLQGKIKKITYKKGTFLDARHNRAHLDNEQNSITLSSSKGDIVVKQIAGLIARRIVCWVKEGDQLYQGQRYGLIRFGSQVDVIIPSNVTVVASVGDKVVGGKTVLAKWTT